jgi:hypothetical protein
MLLEVRFLAHTYEENSVGRGELTLFVGEFVVKTSYQYHCNPKKMEYPKFKF